MVRSQQYRIFIHLSHEIITILNTVFLYTSTEIITIFNTVFYNALHRDYYNFEYRIFIHLH